MSILSLILSIIALVLAYLAYTKSGGSTEELRSKVEDLGISTDNLRAKTADALNRLEKSIRGQNRQTDGRTESPGETVEGEIVDQETDNKDK